MDYSSNMNRFQASSSARPSYGRSSGAIGSGQYVPRARQQPAHRPSNSSPMNSYGQTTGHTPHSQSLALSGYVRQTRPFSSIQLRNNDDEPRRQGWREWAGEKISKARARVGASTGASSPAPALDVTEVITLFPGWAARRYTNRPEDPDAPKPFEVEVSTSGYVISYRNRDDMSRSHRAFVRLAKGFAALPKLVTESASPMNRLSSTSSISVTADDLLGQSAGMHLPPRPDEMDAAYEAAYREEVNERSPLSHSSSVPNIHREYRQQQPQAQAQAPYPYTTESFANLTADAINKLHLNLEERLKPFWSSVVSNRTVRLHLYASPRHDAADIDPIAEEDYWTYNKPLATTEVQTGVDGSFQARFSVGWDELCQHPRGLHIAFGIEDAENRDLEHDVVVGAELVPLVQEQPPVPYASYQSARRLAPTPSAPKAPTKAQIHIPITHSPIRVISDVDDTVKQSGILNGARSVFYNVFAKELDDCIVPGMGAWYTDMWKKGTRFHYVSNGPFEYIAVLNAYFPLSKLPPGSVKLKSYARRSLFNGLLTNAAGRKRAGVEEVLDAFPESRFFLIGDSGEQDLELYADLARARPNNILGIFVRDVSTIEGVTDPIDDPTGWHAVVAHATSVSLGLDPNANLEDSRLEAPGDEANAPGDLRRPASTRSLTRQSVSEMITSVGRRSGSISTYFMGQQQQKAVAEWRDGTRYWDEEIGFEDPESGFTAEPEEVRQRAAAEMEDAEPTPRPRSIPTMPSIPPPAPMYDDDRWITEPPKPIPPPSINKTSRPSSIHSATSNRSRATSATSSTAAALAELAASRRSQRAGDTASSLSTSSSTTSSSHLSLSHSGRSDTESLSGSSTGGHRPQTSFERKVARLTRAMSTATTVEDRRRAEVQLRVWRARTVMPPHVVLRLFRHPEECVEAMEILERELADA